MPTKRCQGVGVWGRKVQAATVRPRFQSRLSNFLPVALDRRPRLSASVWSSIKWGRRCMLPTGWLRGFTDSPRESLMQRAQHRMQEARGGVPQPNPTWPQVHFPRATYVQGENPLLIYRLSGGRP